MNYMFSLQKLIAGGSKFYDLLDASANEAKASVDLIEEMLKTSDYEKSIEQLIELRRRHKKIKWKITEELCSTFATPIEREDIEQIAGALYKVPKALFKFAEESYAGNRELPKEYFLQQAELLDKAMDIVSTMVHALRKNENPKKMKIYNEQIQMLEGEADKRMLAMNRELYSGQYDALTVIMLKEINGLIEKAIDRCRDAGNVIFQVTLKYS